jgi:DNA adenine methylase
MPLPVLKSAGGKRKLVPTLRALMPKKFGTYYEPFVGGGALFFDVQPPRAALADLNSKLVNVYRQLRDNPHEVIEHLELFTNDGACFQRIRARNFDKGSLSERAAEYIYCNKVGFNGLYRENKTGQFNVPFGRYDNPRICDKPGLLAAGAALAGVAIYEEDFRRVLERPVAGDFVYLDPPYEPVSKTSNFTGYTKFNFTRDDQVILRDETLKLKQRGVHVILSNSSAAFIREIYAGKDWTVQEIQAARAINSDGAKRGNVTELVIT